MPVSNRGLAVLPVELYNPARSGLKNLYFIFFYNFLYACEQQEPAEVLGLSEFHMILLILYQK